MKSRQTMGVVIAVAALFAFNAAGASAGVLNGSNQQAPDNAAGTPGYFEYSQGGLSAFGFTTETVAPNGALSFTAPMAAAPNSADGTTCIDNVQISSETRGSAIGKAQIDCTSKSSISDAQFEMWQRPWNVTSGGWGSKGIYDADPSGGFTPYDSGWQPARSCTAGYTIHYEFGANVITPDGGSPEEWNSNNTTCQP